MQRDDVQGLCELASEGLAAGGGFIQRMHEGIAERPFQILGVGALPARVIHDRIAGSVYGGLRRACTAVGRAGAALWGQSADVAGPRLAATPAGSISLAILNGLYGDHVKQRGNSLAFEMEIRRDAQAIPPTPAGLLTAFPDATSRMAVFVHGLFETDESWRHPPLFSGQPRRPSYGERLQDELSFTPVHVRYNTGLHVSDNGRELARLLDALADAWPTEVEEIVLVGHSMGGLLARSACHYGEEANQRWAHAVRHVFCLGAPHLGADLEKGLNVLGSAFSRLPETRAFAGLINARSVGIKDLRFGSCVEEDWCDCDLDEFLQDRCQEVPFLPDANYYFVAVQVAEGRVGSLVGDLLVRIPSASGRGDGTSRRIPFNAGNGLELAGLTHFDLLNHPSVYEQIRSWIRRPSLPAPSRAAARAPRLTTAFADG